MQMQTSLEDLDDANICKRVWLESAISVQAHSTGRSVYVYSLTVDSSILVTFLAFILCLTYGQLNLAVVCILVELLFVMRISTNMTTYGRSWRFKRLK